MPRFFVRADAITEDSILITGSDALHISRSLRMREGEEITVCDMRRLEYRCRLAGFTADTVRAEILAVQACATEPPYFATLYMALPKGDKMELIVQKSVELGVSRIVPFASSRSVVRLDRAAGEKKRERWQKIADAAAGQCGRGILPEVTTPVSFEDALREASADTLSFFCYEGDAAGENAEAHSLPKLLQKVPEARNGAGSDSLPRISFFVGAEGGFAVEEVEKACAAGLPTVGLGPRILRCETAPLYVLTCLSYAFEL